MLLGPFFGSGFFYFGGYKAPFLAFASIYILSFPFVFMNLVNSEKAVKISVKSNEQIKIDIE